MLMRGLCLVLAFYLCTLTGNVNAAEPAGAVVTMPLDTWTYRSGESTLATGALMVPKEMDDTGTLSLVVRANAATTLIRMPRIHAPESVQFLFREADDLYIHVPRRVGWSPETTETLRAFIPYDKNTTEPRTRTIRLVDAAGEPLHGFNLRISFPMQSNGYGHDPKPSFPIRHDGEVHLPLVISPVKRISYPYMPQTPVLYHLYLTDSGTSQTYDVSIPETDRTEPTTVMVPVIGGEAPTGVDILEGEILDHAGVRTNDVGISFGSMPPMMSGIKYDPTTITVKMLTPAPDGTFKIAISDDFLGPYDTDEGLNLHVRQHVGGLFESVYKYFLWGSGARVKLPKRLNLVASLVEADGRPIVLSELLTEGVYPNFSFAQVDANGKRLQQGSMSVNRKETTGSLFNLINLPVPGRYMVTAFDKTYGPVEVGETSPTDALKFIAADENGRRIGVVKDETGKPLAGALVLLLAERPARTGYEDAAALVEQLKSADTERGLELLNAITSGTLGYVITSDDGEYTFPRKMGRANGNYPFLFALAPHRFSAYEQDTTNEHEVLPSMDVTLSEVRLPIKTRATGVVNAPAMVPGNDHLGKLMLLPPGEQKYRVYLWNTRSWFGPSQFHLPGWQYETGSEEFSFGQAFEYDVPVGTSYSLAARPVDYQLYLNMHLWRQGPAVAGEKVELPTATLRALQPFHLKVVYADGSPAEGLMIGALYNTEHLNINGQMRKPITDANGEYLLYGDEGDAPAINIIRYQPMHASERFKIQPLDMSTSVPTLTLRLDPKIWGPEGKGMQ